MKKSELSEQDIRTKYITPAILKAGWDREKQLREGFPLPSLSEQKESLVKLMSFFWFDDLKEKLSRSQQTDQRLLEALVNGILEEEDDENEKSEEAIIYQMPQKRMKDKNLAKVSGMSTTDVQAGIMAQAMNGYERYEDEKDDFKFNDLDQRGKELAKLGVEIWSL